MNSISTEPLRQGTLFASPGESQMKVVAELAGGISEKDAEGGLLLIKSNLSAFSQSALFVSVWASWKSPRSLLSEARKDEKERYIVLLAGKVVFKC